MEVAWSHTTGGTAVAIGLEFAPARALEVPSRERARERERERERERDPHLNLPPQPSEGVLTHQNAQHPRCLRRGILAKATRRQSEDMVSAWCGTAGETATR